MNVANHRRTHMKLFVGCLVIAVSLSWNVLGQTQSNAPASSAQKSSIAQSDLGPLSEEQIAAFITEWNNDKGNEKIIFNASFGVRSLSVEEKRKYQKSGKIPLRLTADLSQVKDVHGKKLSERMTGTAHFYILDPAGQIIEKKSMSLAKMCPS